MTYYNPKIPEKNGGFLCIPFLNLIPQLIKSNKEKFKAYNFIIGDEGFHEFRKRLREKVIQLSEKFTANLGIKSRLYNNSDTIVQTGHQPLFYHPGITIKNLLLNKIGLMEGINAINLIVDTDNFKEIAVNIPNYKDGIKIEKEILFSNQYPIPYEFSAPPSQEAFNLFIEGIKYHLSHPQFKNLHDNFNEYTNKINYAGKNFNTLSEFMTAIRRIYENEIESEYLEIPLSSICDTDEFLIFFLSVVMESEKFTSIYNCHLERYRKEHKLRYPANPFPNLSIEDEKIELPFWHFYPHTYSQRLSMPISGGSTPAGIGVGVRGRVFAKNKDDTVIVSFEGGDSIEFDKKELYNGIDLIKKNNIKIRPKAIILTLFNRLFVSDAFIHGVGGTKYDRITDEIIRDFYKVEPPEFITTSLTLYPNVEIASPTHLCIGVGARNDRQSGVSLRGAITTKQSNLIKENLQDEIKRLEKKLRDMRYNPERYIIPPTPPLVKGGLKGDLLKEKENLISILKTDNINKKEISMKLKEINERIYQKIEPSVRSVESEMKILKKRQDELEAIQRRDYPYFLFSLEEIMKLLAMSQYSK